jgi:hypothetical protein
MKKMIVILALVMVVCAPAMAAVTISGSRSGGTIVLSYSVTGPNSVRAFAMDLSVSTGNVSGVSCSNASYWVYPGSIQISGGSVTGSGTCVCASTYPGTKGGVGTSAVTVEMGSLYTGSAPVSSGTLLTLTISDSAATVTVARNTARGAVVMENPDESASDNLPLTIPGAPPDCLYVGRVFSGSGITNLTITTTHIWRWTQLGKPNCWCCNAQKRGNAVYTPTSTATKTDLIDLAKIKNTAQYGKSLGETGYNNNPCCDTNLSGKIDLVDLAKAKNTVNYGKVTGAGPPCL